MALAVAHQNKTSYKAFVDIVKFANALFLTPILPKSAYLLDQYLNSTDGFKRHFYCEKCMYAFGVQDNKIVKRLRCPNGHISDIQDLTKATYFVQYDLVRQLQLLFEDHNIRSKLKDPRALLNLPPSAVITDMYDAKCYRKFVSTLENDGKSVISFIMCLDGTPLFSSSTLSIWPCFLSINELPPVIRMRNLLLGGLWFGREKPPMDLFLGPLVEHLITLSSPGFNLFFNNDVLSMKAYGIGICVDAAARGPVQCINIHAGYYSCNWCEHPGEYIDNAVRFPCLEELPAYRTHESVVMAGRRCLENPQLEYVMGVRGVSPLINLPKFDMVDGFVQDFPHNVPFGIGRVFLTEWITNTNRESSYIGSPENLSSLEKKIASLTPPIEVRRKLRKINDYKHWKMREYENWILFFSIIVLTGILNRKYVDHWTLLVQACYYLSLENVSAAQINIAHVLLVHFVRGVEKLYGPNFMSYNVHILNHLAESVSRWSSVQYVSTYAYENGNGELKDVLHAHRGIPHQIQRFLSQKQALQILKNHFSSAKTNEFIESISSKPHMDKAFRVGDDSILTGSSTRLVPTDEETFLLGEFAIESETCEVYAKMIHNKCVYTSNSIQKKSITDNSVAVLHSGVVVLIHKIVYDRSSEKIFCFCVNLNLETFLKFPSHIAVLPKDHCIHIVTHESARLRIVPISDLKCVCCRSFMNDKQYVSRMPNLLNVF